MKLKKTKNSQSIHNSKMSPNILTNKEVTKKTIEYLEY